MFTLVKFENGDFYVTESRHVKEEIYDECYIVKYRGSRYKASLYLKSDNKKFLLERKKKYEEMVNSPTTSPLKKETSVRENLLPLNVTSPACSTSQLSVLKENTLPFHSLRSRSKKGKAYSDKLERNQAIAKQLNSEIISLSSCSQVPAFLNMSSANLPPKSVSITSNSNHDKKSDRKQYLVSEVNQPELDLNLPLSYLGLTKLKTSNSTSSIKSSLTNTNSNCSAFVTPGPDFKKSLSHTGSLTILKTSHSALSIESASRNNKSFSSTTKINESPVNTSCSALVTPCVSEDVQTEPDLKKSVSHTGSLKILDTSNSTLSIESASRNSKSFYSTTKINESPANTSCSALVTPGVSEDIQAEPDLKKSLSHSGSLTIFKTSHSTLSIESASRNRKSFSSTTKINKSPVNTSCSALVTPCVLEDIQAEPDLKKSMSHTGSLKILETSNSTLSIESASRNSKSFYSTTKINESPANTTCSALVTPGVSEDNQAEPDFKKSLPNTSSLAKLNTSHSPQFVKSASYNSFSTPTNTNDFPSNTNSSFYTSVIHNNSQANQAASFNSQSFFSPANINVSHTNTSSSCSSIVTYDVLKSNPAEIDLNKSLSHSGSLTKTNSYNSTPSIKSASYNSTIFSSPNNVNVSSTNINSSDSIITPEVSESSDTTSRRKCKPFQNIKTSDIVNSKVVSLSMSNTPSGILRSIQEKNLINFSTDEVFSETLSSVKYSSIPLSSTAKSSLLNSTQNTSNNTTSEYFPQSSEINNCDSTQNTSARDQSIEIIENPLNLCNVKVQHKSRVSKKHFCIFCHTLQTKISRHFYLKHNSEIQIKEALKFPMKSKERTKIIEELRKKGDFLHNTSKEHNSGVLIVSRRQRAEQQNTPDDYLCCKQCKGFFSKNTLRIHVNKCNKAKQKFVRDNFKNSRALSQNIHKSANNTLRTKVFPVLRNDSVSKVLRYDELVIKYANKLTEKYTLDHQHDLIRSELRLLGRFLNEVKSLDSRIRELKDIFKPYLFDACVESLRKTAKWDDKLKWFRTPAVAQHLTTLIKKCGKTQQAELIKLESDEEIKQLQYFLQLWEEDIRFINKKALDDQCTQKRSKKITLPSKHDIKRLYMFLKNKMFDAIDVLQKEFNISAWNELVKSSLIFIQIFNRRRAGEIERLTIESYSNREEITETVGTDILEQMSKESITFAKQFVRLVLRGKLGRTVSVLLSPLCIRAIDLILKYRTQAGIPQRNEYIFSKRCASKFSKPYYRACKLLKEFSEQCGAEMPHKLRGTTLRKHIATYTSLLNVEDATVDRLATFMGHHKDIHKSIYRVSVPAAEIMCVSKLLMSAVGDEEDNDREDLNVQDLNKDTSRTIFELQDEDEEITIFQDISSTKQGESINESSSSKKRLTERYGKTKRTKWAKEERDALYAVFGDFKELKKLPSLRECWDATKTNKCLQNRTPQQIKSWIDNQRRYK